MTIRWFRLFLAAWTAVAVGLLGWLASHRSAEGTIFGRYSSSYFLLLLGVAAVAVVLLMVHYGPVYRRLHGLRREIVLLLCSIVVMLMVLEVTVRVIDPLGISHFDEFSRYELELLPDPVRVYRLAPGLHRTYQGVTVSTNELGFRDRELRTKRKGDHRVLLLGDSVTFGWGVPVEATFGRRLEDILTSRLGRPVETVNTGVPSYNTSQERAVLEAYADTIDPDLVVLIYVDNDIVIHQTPFDPRAQRSLRGKSPPQVIMTLLARSWLHRLGLFVLGRSRWESLTSFNEDAVGVQESMKALADIAALCRSRAVPFIVFFYRTPYRARLPNSPALVAAVQAVGQRHGFLVEDVATWWGNVDMRSMVNSTVDSHPNAAGHRLLAERMANVLMERGLLRP